MRSRIRYAALAVISCVLQGCGFSTPAFNLAATDTASLSPFVTAVTGHIACELRNAVLYSGAFRDELRKWSAEVTLKLAVDERTGLSPGLSYSAPSVFSLGVGGNLSGEATRYLELTWYVFFDSFVDEPNAAMRTCPSEGPQAIQGDLKIAESLFAALHGVFPQDSAAPTEKFGPLKVVKHHVSFEIAASGSVTPGWKFARVTVNPNGPFLDSKRTRTDDLLITMGRSEVVPAKRGRGREAVVSEAVRQSHFVGQINSALRSLVRGDR